LILRLVVEIVSLVFVCTKQFNS